MADVALVAELEAEASVMLPTLVEVHCLCAKLEVADVSTLSDVVFENKERLQNAEEELNSEHHKHAFESEVVDEAVSIQRHLVDLCTKLEVADVSTLSDVVLENKEQLQNAEKELQKLQHLQGQDNELPGGHVQVVIDGVKATGKITGKVGTTDLYSCLPPFS
jgi:hypothetical protein